MSAPGWFPVALLWIAVGAMFFRIWIGAYRESKHPTPLVPPPRSPEPFTWTAPADRRGQLISVTVVTCQRCLDEATRPVSREGDGHVIGLSGAGFLAWGWRHYESKYWLCPMCTQSIDQLAAEVLV